MEKYAEIHSEQQIVKGYREGMTVEGLIKTLYYHKKIEDKKITLKSCKIVVEQAIYNYLMSLKE